MTQWHEKKILITGGASGIGLATTKLALEMGAEVSVLVRTVSPELAELKQKKLHIFEGDVAKREIMQAWIQSAIEALGSINTVINNAGAMYYMDMLRPKYEQMKTMIETNCLGFIHLIEQVMPHLKETKEAHLINITSDAGRQPFPGLAVYSGTKAFVEFTAKAMRLELLKHQIKITNIQPGNVDTNLHNKSTEKDSVEVYGTQNNGQYLHPNDVAEAIVYAISTPHNVAVNEILVEPLSESIAT